MAGLTVPAQTGVQLAAFAGMLAGGLGYHLGQRPGGYKRSTVLLLKGSTTLMAALMALVAAMWFQQPASWWLFAGLCVCAAADVALELKFEVGMLVFALGHVCYMVAFTLRRAPSLKHLAVFAVLAAGVLTLYPRFKPKLKALYVPVIAYSLLIGAMLALSVTQPWPARVGAVLFVVSDCFILYRLVRPAGKYNDAGCIALYYLGQYLLAVSAFYA